MEETIGESVDICKRQWRVSWHLKEIIEESPVPVGRESCQMIEIVGGVSWKLKEKVGE